MFDLLYGADLSEAGDDTLSGFNVNTFALQVPTKDVTRGGETTIGVWSTASRPSMRIENGDGSQTFKGKNVQVSRLGSPLVNEVVVPVGLKDYFNSSKPKADGAALPLVQDPELPHLLNAVYGTDVPDSDPDTAGIQRADLIQVFLTGVPDAEPARERQGQRDVASEHGDRAVHDRLLGLRRDRRRRGRASRTVAGSPTTSSMSRCGRCSACC